MRCGILICRFSCAQWCFFSAPVGRDICQFLFQHWRRLLAADFLITVFDVLKHNRFFMRVLGCWNFEIHLSSDVFFGVPEGANAEGVCCPRYCCTVFDVLKTCFAQDRFFTRSVILKCWVRGVITYRKGVITYIFRWTGSWPITDTTSGTRVYKNIAIL